MLSVITTGRNDDYGGGFLDRFYASLFNNIKGLFESSIEYEYVVSEWMPFRSLLLNDNSGMIASMLYKARTVVVDRSLAEPEKLNPDVFFEYFAKNAAVRRARFDNILLVNSDIILPQPIMDEIVHLVKSGLDDNKFYRTRFRQQARLDSPLNPIQTTDLHNPAWDDSCICGAYSGDFLLITKKAFVEVGQGYNEVDPDHRVTYQTNMDGEILWNMHNAGMKLEFVNSPYIHIEHGKDRVYDSAYKNGLSYTNKPDWGFTSYPCKTQDNGQTEVIYHA